MWVLTLLPLEVNPSLQPPKHTKVPRGFICNIVVLLFGYSFALHSVGFLRAETEPWQVLVRT